MKNAMTNEEIKNAICEIAAHLNKISEIAKKLEINSDNVFCEANEWMPTVISATFDNANNNYDVKIHVSDIQKLQDVLGAFQEGKGYDKNSVRLSTELNGVEVIGYKRVVGSLEKAG